MTPEEIMSFYKKSGFRIFHSKSAWWYNEYRQGNIFYVFPQHRLIDPSKDETKEIFDATGAKALRFLAPAGTSGKNSFLWVRRGPYEIEMVEKKRRNLIRKGLQNCQVRQVSWKELMERGWESHQDTQVRHGERPDSLGVSENLENCPAYECWGSFVQNKLAAYVVTLHVEDWVHIIMGRSANAYLQYYPNEALVFQTAQTMLKRSGVSAVSYGWESLSELGSLDHFKESLGFQKEPVSQRVVLHPRLHILKNPLMLGTLTTFCSLLPFPRFKRMRGFLKAAALS